MARMSARQAAAAAAIRRSGASSDSEGDVVEVKPLKRSRKPKKAEDAPPVAAKDPLKGKSPAKKAPQKRKARAAAESSASDRDEDSDAPLPPKKAARPAKPYAPRPDTANHAFLVNLYIELKRGRAEVAKPELMNLAVSSGLASHSSVFGNPDADGSGFAYDGWSSLGNMVKRGLVSKSGRAPVKAALTEEGRTVAAGLYLGALKGGFLTAALTLPAGAGVEQDAARGSGEDA